MSISFKFILLCYVMLWVSRNKAIHDGFIPDIPKLAIAIKKSSLAHAVTWLSISAKEVQVWIPPQEGTFKINFDTAIRDIFSAQAAVCRDHTGSIIKVVSQISPPCSPNYGEAQRALLAPSLAFSLQLKHFVIKGDSQTVISALNFPALSQDWHIDHLIVDTLTLLSPSPLWEANKINRSANFCAYHVAFWAAARASSSSGCIPLFPPLSFLIACSGLEPPSVFFPP